MPAKAKDGIGAAALLHTACHVSFATIEEPKKTVYAAFDLLTTGEKTR